MSEKCRICQADETGDRTVGSNENIPLCNGVPAPAPDRTIVCEPMPEPQPLPRDYLVRVDGEFLRDTRGRLRKFTEPGAHRWADRHTPMSYSVVLLERA